MTKDLQAFAKRYDDMTEVAELYLKDRLNPTEIARRTGMKRVDVMAAIEEFASIARNDEVLQQRVRDALHEADKTVDLVQRENWKLTEEPEIELKTKATVLKNITDIEFKRQEMIRNAGLLQDAEVGDHYAAIEEKQEALEKILKEIVLKCPNCKAKVMHEMAKFSNVSTEVIVVNGD